MEHGELSRPQTFILANKLLQITLLVPLMKLRFRILKSLQRKLPRLIGQDEIIESQKQFPQPTFPVRPKCLSMLPLIEPAHLWKHRSVNQP